MALYRSLLADKQLLIILEDNARDRAAARPLLPGSPRSLVLATSRNQLTGLAATDGARLLTLTSSRTVRLCNCSLPGSAASRIAGPPRSARSPPAARGSRSRWRSPRTRAATRPRFPLAALAEEFRDAADRLDALDGADPARARARTLFSW